MHECAERPFVWYFHTGGIRLTLQRLPALGTGATFDSEITTRRGTMDEQRAPRETFDPDLPPENIHNREAAKARGLRFDPRKKAYVDDEGCLVRDRFGQPY
ncbi:MAG TPA: hypothetical protein VMT80_02365 [Candidatus Paceibacterota bacterium]|nr:hypothetical protein [Candidatus Paceibacterota bacterium]